jgi:hypothetical protein
MWSQHIIGGAAMNLQNLLDRIGMNRNSFNSAERSGWFPYLARQPGKGRDQFGEQHVLGMMIHNRLRALGMEPGLAGMAVKASFDAITAFTEGRPAPGDRYDVGARRLVSPENRDIEIWDYLGWPDARMDGWRELGRISVDLRAVAAAAPESAGDEGRAA